MTRAVHVIACGALATELAAVVEINRFDHVTVEHLPGHLHNRPDRIPEALRKRLDRLRTSDDGGSPPAVIIGYADCGTGGAIDELCRAYDATRLPGAHCYELYAGAADFASLHDEEPGTFYLTDYLARHFDAVVWRPLGLDRHPELRDAYFGNYARVVHLAQSDEPTLAAAAERAADRLGLPLQQRFTGLGDLSATVVAIAGAS